MSKKVKIKNLIHNYFFTRASQRKPNMYKDYPWKALKDSIIKNGLLEPILVSKCPSMDEENNKLLKKANNILFIKKDGFLKDTKYIILGGNHRTIVLKELYGEEYEVDCDIM
jgi:hypothetical protein